jgi:hypothetical protein
VLLALMVAAVLYIAIDRNVREHRDRYFTEFRGRVAVIAGWTLVLFGLAGGLMITH